MQVDKSVCEVKALYANHLHHTDVKPHPIDNLINYYSSWHKLKKAVAYIIKVKRWLLSKIRKAVIESSMYVSTKDLENAETQIIFMSRLTRLPMKSRH